MRIFYLSNKVDPQVQFALNYVKENKYAYGPAYSSKNLVWNVDKIEESDSGITRIYINYKVSEESKNYGCLLYTSDAADE